MMSDFNFYNKNIHTDLEIPTNDISLFVHRMWLIDASPYFKALLTNGMIESKSNIIKLNHDSSINLLFTIIHSPFTEYNDI